MKRLTSLFCGLTLAAAIAGCGGNGGTTPGTDAAPTGKVDMMGGGGPIPDLTMGPMGAPTGDPCKANTDCAKSLKGTMTTPQCIKSGTVNGKPTMYKNGYCSSPCRPSQSDPSSGLNGDCPSDSGTCELVSQTAGRCVKLCMAADTDCRVADDYVCENNTPYAASCTPKSPNWCDPKMPTSCPKAMDGNSQICISFSPDESSGQCAELCDVFMQNCPMPMMGANACLANPTTGQATCINTGANKEGDACRYLNECIPGLACHSEGNMGVCRTYCRVTGMGGPGDASVPDGGGGGGDVGCPMGQTCKDLSANVKKNKIGICAP